MAKLLVQESTGVREFELVDNEVHIGRELDNTLRISDPSISRHHAVIRRSGAAYEVQDLQSSNGVLVNGTRVPVSPLQDGDRLTLGQIQITFMDPTPAVAPASPLGTVRMDASEMAKLHGGVPFPTNPVENLQHTDTLPAAGVPAPPIPKPPVQPPVQPPTPAHAAFEDAKGAFLGLLPPQPDLAKPTGERGDFVTRMVAYAIDLAPIFVLQVISLVLQFGALGAAGMGGLRSGAAGFGLAGLLGCLGLLLGLSYLFLMPWCWVTYGTTPGKKIMKLRVVPLGKPEARMEVGPAILRLLGYFANGIIGVILSTIVMGGVTLVLGMKGLGMVLILSPIIGLLCQVLPFLMILGTERRDLPDIFSSSEVIKVDR